MTETTTTYRLRPKNWEPSPDIVVTTDGKNFSVEGWDSPLTVNEDGPIATITNKAGEEVCTCFFLDGVWEAHKDDYSRSERLPELAAALLLDFTGFMG